MKYFFNLLICLCFVSVLPAQTPQELKSYLPVIAGWEIKPEIEVFQPDNLYQRINGAAPLFLENNFREMTSMVYTHGEDYITIQAYRHASPVDAFGMYASERSSDMDFFAIGGEAQGDNIGLYCFAGSMYLKMQANNESEEIGKIIQVIAKGLCEKIAPNAGYPAIFKSFPQEGKLPHTEAYITSNYIGHEFLKSAFTCDYDLEGKQFQVFVVDAKTKDQAKGMLTKYVEFTKQPVPASEGKLTIKDRYNGDIPCIWKGQYIIGIFNEAGDELNEDTLLQKIAENLK